MLASWTIRFANLCFGEAYGLDVEVRRYCLGNKLKAGLLGAIDLMVRGASKLYSLAVQD